jgi:hypothetical protein
MLQKIKLSEILIIILIVIIFLQRCGGGHIPSTGIKIIRDTTWIEKSNTINSKPQLIKTEPYAVPIDRWNTEYLPDTSYKILIKQYEELVRQLLAKNVFSDSIKIDSIGHIYITDTVSRNLLTGRSTHYNLKYPVIKETIIIPEKKRIQVYIGGAVQAGQNRGADGVNAGLLLKTKRDQIYGVYGGFNLDKSFQVGVQMYWKIKIKK